MKGQLVMMGHLISWGVAYILAVLIVAAISGGIAVLLNTFVAY